MDFAPPGEAAELAALELLRGPGLRRALDTVLAAHGMALDRRRLITSRAGPAWRLLSLHHRPGAGVTGVYAVRLRHRGPVEAPGWPGPLPGQQPGEAVVCLSTGAMPAHSGLPGEGSSWGDPGAVVVAADGWRLTGWLWPQDPWLPGLRSSARLIAGAAGPSSSMIPAPIAYRPTRRAVVRLEATGTGGPAAWLKIVRPERAADLLHRHTLLREAGVPVPRPLGSTGDGAVLLAHLPGHPAARIGGAEDPRGPGLSAEHLLALLDRLPSSVLELPRRPSWTDRVLDYGRSAAAALPSAADQVRAHAEAVEAARRAADRAELVPSHGDFHAGNVMVGDRVLDPVLGPITGLLDLDSAGPGRLDDDLACYLAHRCAQLPEHEDRSPVEAASIAPALEVFDGVVDPAALRVRTSGVLLSLVSSAARRGGQEAAARRLLQSQRVLRAAESV